MKTRAAKFVAAIVASVLSSANPVAAPDDAEPATEQVPDLAAQTRRRPAVIGATASNAAPAVNAGTSRQTQEKAARKPPRKQRRRPKSPPRRRRARSRHRRARFPTRARNFSRAPAEPDSAAGADPAAPAAAGNRHRGGQPSLARCGNMLAPAPAARWPDPMTDGKSRAPMPAGPRPNKARKCAPHHAACPAPGMPRAVPPMPASEKPLSLADADHHHRWRTVGRRHDLRMLVGWRASRPRRCRREMRACLGEAHGSAAPAR